MNVVIFVDKYGSAIWRLAEAVKKHATSINIVVYPVHPKRNDADTLIEAQRLMQWADVIDIHYWKSGEVLKTSFPSEFQNKKKVLFHFNPYDLEKQDWRKDYDLVVVGNKTMHDKMPWATYIGYGVDLKQFKFNDVQTQDKVVHMSVNRIESKKGVLEVAEACRELGYHLQIIGRVSDGDYMRSVMESGAKITFIENATDEQLVQSYAQATVHVCNSTDDFESGTLPILEAMASGVPVLTRNIGHVPELFDGTNMVVRTGKKEHVAELTTKIKELMINEGWRKKIRESAWNTIKNRDDRRMVREITKLYFKLWINDKPLVSIIIPTHDRPESFVDCLVAACSQDYKKVEIIVADSGKVPVRKLVEAAAKKIHTPITYIRFFNEKYSLAEARNRAVIEAQGQFLVFCDDRLKMEPDAVLQFIELQTMPKLWQWGVKDGSEKGFVENFSCIERLPFIQAGMFCERIEWYGGMSQEVRTRFEGGQGFVFEINKHAKATSTMRAISKTRRREDIIEAKNTVFKMYE